MSEIASGGFEINTKKVLKLLVGNLYGDDPHLTIRELLQNAHDAIQSLHNPSAGEIIVRLNPFGEDRYIEISDTGCGMDLEDIQHRLCVVGESDKLKVAYEKPEIIGRFGIGFLSSFIIADRVEVRTRKVGQAGQCYLFKASSEGGYAVEELKILPFVHGTSVRLFLKQDYHSRIMRDSVYELITTEGMEKVLVDFGYFLRFPVRLAVGEDQPKQSITARHLPWEEVQSETEAYKVLFDRNEPLFSYSFREVKSDFEAHGIFYFSTEILSRPSARLYSKRLLVDPKDSDLLPEYGGFTYCIVECPSLNLDLARRGAAQSDPIYKMLRKVVREKFTEAFYSLSAQYPSTLFKVWPNVDNRVISALLQIVNEKDSRFSEEQKVAKQFLIRCGPHIPFYILDRTSGGSGIPLWKSIHQLTERIETQTSNGRTLIPFTESKTTVEKDMLLERYPELIDVGRSDKNAHKGLIRMLVTLSEHFDSFELLPVSVSQFDPIGDGERSYWEALRQDIEKGASFYKKDHTVAVERFFPNSTPVMITSTTVSGEVVGALREQFQKLAAVPEQAVLMVQLQQHLDRMGSQEGLVTIHINANNDLMGKLAEGYINPVMRKAASQGVMSITWRAIVDYYGVGATRDMLARDRRNMEDLMQNVLDMVGELHKQQESLDQSAKELKQLQEKVSTLEPISVEDSLAAKDLFVGVIDISNSTRDLMGNPSCSPEHKALFLQRVLHALATKIDGFARVIGFTGDGLQFCIDPKSQNSKSVGAKIQSLPNELSTVIADDGELARLCKQLGVTEVRLRIAVDYGQVFVGLVGKREEALGLPFVRATRLSSEKNLFDQHKVSLLLTERAYDSGTEQKFWTARQFCLAEKSLEVGGLSQPIEVYKPNT
jgi:class 3 adenylate cyclase